MTMKLVAVAVICLRLPFLLYGQDSGTVGPSSQRPAQFSVDLGTVTQPAAQPTARTEPEGDAIAAVPNRPTFATTALTVQPGVLEIEYGFQGDRTQQNINGLVKFGLFRSLELRFAQNPIEMDSGVASTGVCGIGFKWKFLLQHQAKPDLALLYSSTVSIATSPLGVAATGHSVQALVSKDFGKNHFDVNEGVQFVGRGVAVNGFDRNYFSAMSWSRAVSGKWGATAELAGFSWTNSQTPATMTILAAATYSVSPRLVLDAGAYAAAYGNLPRVTTFFGATYSISDLYHRAGRGGGG